MDAIKIGLFPYHCYKTAFDMSGTDYVHFMEAVGGSAIDPQLLTNIIYGAGENALVLIAASWKTNEFDTFNAKHDYVVEHITPKQINEVVDNFFEPLLLDAITISANKTNLLTALMRSISSKYSQTQPSSLQEETSVDTGK